MRCSSIGALLLGAYGAQAFKNSSPFIYVSTEALPFSTPQISSASSLLSLISDNVLGSDQSARCPTDHYIIINQPGISREDMRLRNFEEGMETLQALYEKRHPDIDVKASSAVQDVIGGMPSLSLEQLVIARCGGTVTRFNVADGKGLEPAKEGENAILIVDMTRLLGEPSRKQSVMESDIAIGDILRIWAGKHFTMLYTGTPPSTEELQEPQEALEYEMDDSQSPLHIELKRDLSMHAREDNLTLPDGPLFEKYQFLTPGIFMGLITFFFLFSIGYIGISALGSLQVSYGAFDKDMGPQAQRKAQ